MILFLLIILGNFNGILGMENARSSSRAGHTTLTNHNWKRLREMCWHDPAAIAPGMHDNHRLFGDPRYKRAFRDPPPVAPMVNTAALLQMQNLASAGMMNPNPYSVQNDLTNYHHVHTHHLHTHYTGDLRTYSNMVYYFYDNYHDHMVSLMDDLQRKFSSTDPEREVKFFMVYVSHDHKADFESIFREAKSVLPYFSICKGGAQIQDVSEENVIRDFINQALNRPVLSAVPPMLQQMPQPGMQGGQMRGGMQGGMQGGQQGRQDGMDGPME
ncbi:hypothetical protein DdX_09126 [Ditylenchus destructor]|uniref:Uncharacterized protein n=1 Tax=Ditylenchus destructor TaxID=166010 RepID=A0AAD4N2Y9_9BILA|nr:hypothetical protein DdX_09126 [Ditylenchus destructor]